MRFRGKKIKIQEVVDKLKKDEIYECEIKIYNPKRTLDQNSYYWSLLSQFADYERINKLELHHIMIARYGQYYEKLEVVAPIEYDYTKDQEGIYLSPIENFVNEKGQKMQRLRICKGSSEYNTKEMSILIDGLIGEITSSEAEIDTMSKTEMMRLWGLF